MPRVTITVPGNVPQPYRFQLDRQTVTIGRGSENDISIDCGSVSVKHAEMCRVHGGYELRDLGSTNGIKLDEERLDVIPLSNGSSVKLGDVAFDFELTEEELVVLAAEQSTESLPIEIAAVESAVENEPVQSEPVEREPVVELKKNNLPPLGILEEDDEPVREMKPVRVPAAGSGFGILILFVILVAAAFFGGMAVRFQEDTGGSLIDAIKAKQKGVESKEVPADDDEEPE